MRVPEAMSLPPGARQSAARCGAICPWGLLRTFERGAVFFVVPAALTQSA